jgi:metal-responsive CopG/Arc/MetJ family transcriptional regulator
MAKHLRLEIRLDEADAQALDDLRERLGVQSRSAVIRKALNVLWAQTAPSVPADAS